MEKIEELQNIFKENPRVFVELKENNYRDFLRMASPLGFRILQGHNLRNIDLAIEKCPEGFGYGAYYNNFLVLMNSAETMENTTLFFEPAGFERKPYVLNFAEFMETKVDNADQDDDPDLT